MGEVVSIIIAVGMGSDDKKSNRLEKPKSKKGKFAVLNDKIERESWIAAQGQNINKLQVENSESKRDIESLKDQITSLQTNLRDMEMKKRHTVSSAKKSSKNSLSRDSNVPPLPKVDGNSYANGKRSNQYQKPKRLSELSQPKNTIKIYEDKSYQPGNEKKDEIETEDIETKSIILSSGSFMKAVLLNGIDAPTDFGSKGEPYPVLMSVTDTTTLPNLYKMNLKNCFIIGSGYGNLADERAYIRTETLSCITASNRVIDTKLKGHIVGEDGKLGIRGRLLSKQGQLLAQSLLSGTFAGLGEAFKPEKSVSINLSPNGSSGYVEPDMNDFMRAGIAEGASNALNKIADFYLKMAEKIFPIIEIDAGREVEILVLNKAELKIGDAIEESNGGGS